MFRSHELIRTKIIATVGPASQDVAILRKLLAAGVSVFRLNFSHGSLADHAKSVSAIRAAADAEGAVTAIMGDLAGPKIRLDAIPGDRRELQPGDSLRFVRRDSARKPLDVSTSYANLLDELRVGHRVMIDDGQVQLRVADVRDGAAHCVCEAGGVIATRKGVNLPDTPLSLPSLTDKDVQDLEWAVRQELDYVALSFVREANDLVDLRERIRAQGGRLPIVAKIEKPEAVKNINTIIEQCDVLLVARGDLGVEMDLARVPLIQKEIVRQCTYAGRPVIIATQMLQSMVERPAPTRAEVSDVANAILDGADAVMLSAETAIGRHPVSAVTIMHRIAQQTEPSLQRLAREVNLEVLGATMRVTSAVARGAALLARDLDAKAVAVWTKVGHTPRLLSKHRLGVPIVGLSPDAAVCRRMAMYRGVVPVRLAEDADTDAMLRCLDDALMQRGFVQPRDLCLVILGTRLTRPGSTNTLLIHLVHGGEDGTPSQRTDR
ncbi:MAG: pyruvate kinase [Phycisphaerae bacterium]